MKRNTMYTLVNIKPERGKTAPLALASIVSILCYKVKVSQDGGVIVVTCDQFFFLFTTIASPT